MTRTVRLTTELPAAPHAHLQPAPRLAWWVLLVVGLLALLVYANSQHNQFALDDHGIIVNNPAVTNLHWHEIWSGSYWPSKGGPPGDVLYRPLTIYTYLVNQALAPDNPWAFHVVNIGLHALCSLLVTILAWRFVKSTPMALVAGVLFAVHPIHTEVVANVVGRAELLAAFWSLMTLLLFLPADLRGSPLTPPRHWTHGLLVAACFLLALLCKETPATLLVALPLIDLVRWTHADPLTRPRHPWAWWFGRALRYYLPLGVVFGLYLLARIHAVGLMADVHLIGPIVNPLMDATLAQRIVTPFALLARYVVLFVWPRVLAADYSAPSIMPTANPLDPMALLGELLVLGGLCMSYTWWRHRPGLTLSLLLFALSYALVANVLRIGTIFGERLFYWPSVFVCLGVGYAAATCWASRPVRATRYGRLAGIALAVLVITLCGWRTYTRNPDWANNETLAISTARDNPHSAKALAWAGGVLMVADQPQWHEFASTLLIKAVELYPAFAPPYLDLAHYYYDQDQEGLAMIYLARVALADGGHPNVRDSILRFREQMRKESLDQYLRAAQEWQKQHPQDPAGFLALGWCYRAQGKPAEAEAALTQALTLKPEFDEAGAEMGLLLLERGDAVNAVPLLRHYALRANRSAEARCQVAFALLKLDPLQYPNALEEAQNALNSALKLDPEGHAIKVRELQTELQKRKLNQRAKVDNALIIVNPS